MLDKRIKSKIKSRIKSRIKSKIKSRIKSRIKSKKYTKINALKGGNYKLTVTYKLSQNNIVLSETQFSNDLTQYKDQLQTEPEITINYTDSSIPPPPYYIMIMIDPNAPVGKWLHWLYIKSESSIEKDILVKYKGPTPPPNTNIHNYIFNVYIPNIAVNTFITVKNTLSSICNKNINKNKNNIRGDQKIINEIEAYLTSSNFKLHATTRYQITSPSI